MWTRIFQSIILLESCNAESSRMIEKIKTYITREIKRRGLKPTEWNPDKIHFYYKGEYYEIFVKEYSYCFEIYRFRYSTSMFIQNSSFDNFKESIYSTFVIFKKPSWSLIKCATRLLSLHKQAVVTANHPLRKLERGEFETQ